MKKCTGFGWMPIVAVVLALGCSAKNRPGDACDENADCTAGRICVSGECSEPECNQDSDCPEDQTCQDHACRGGGACTTDGQCPIGQICGEGSCVAGCRTDRDCPDELVCIPEKGSHGLCVECEVDADCPSGEKCVDSRCVQRCGSDADCLPGHCDPSLQACVECVQDTHCPAGRICEEHECIEGCRQDADCSPAGICEDGQCREGCRADADCSSNKCDLVTLTCIECLDKSDCELGTLCVEKHCLPGCESMRDCPDELICLPEEPPHGTCVECRGDGDCLEPDRPRCLEGFCQPECVTASDCPLSGQLCIDHVCTTPGCTPEDCASGTWCDTSVGECKPGCDSDDDCLPPNTCNHVTHVCGATDCCGGCAEGWACDTITCTCVTGCQSDEECPTGYTCSTTGKCWCTDLACPDYTHCDPATGDCLRDTCQDDPDCPDGWICNQETQVCESGGGVGEGGVCFADEDCDNEAGLLCDSSLFCIGCQMMDPTFTPTFTCRLECSLLMPSCPVGRDCLYRHVGLKGLCMP